MGKRKSAAEHKRNGTYKPCRHDSGTVPAFPEGLPAKPEGLDSVASATWDKFIAAMPADLLRACDSFALTALCNFWALYQSYGALPADHYRKLILLVTSWKQCDRILRSFGCTPEARGALKNATAAPEADPLEALFENRKRREQNR